MFCTISVPSARVRAAPPVSCRPITSTRLPVLRMPATTSSIAVLSQPRLTSRTEARFGLLPSPISTSLTRWMSSGVWQQPWWWVKLTAPSTWRAMSSATSLEQTTVEITPT